MAAITLKEKAYIQLREFILSGKISPGDNLTEQYLEDLLQMSRTPIRAAMERLAAGGLVNYSPNKGLSVAELSLQRVIDFFDFRIAIESYIVHKLAARKWAEEDFAWFKTNLEHQEQYMKILDYTNFTKTDSEFHLKLAKLNGNQEITRVMENLQDKLFQIALKVLQKDSSRIQMSFADHKAVFELLVQGKADEVEKQMIQHLEFGKQILIL